MDPFVATIIKKPARIAGGCALAIMAVGARVHLHSAGDALSGGLVAGE
jgi:hypothetical protein